MDNPEYYENFEWKKFHTSQIKNKVTKILSIIPDDVNSIIDIGSGNGIITNELHKKYKVTAVDRSKKALSFVNAKKIQADCSNIPIKDNSFDMVFSSELLEHLDENTFNKTLDELKRLTKKYIFITVPNDENIKKTNIQCPECKFIFNRVYHMRSFNHKVFETYFRDFKIVYFETFGKKIRYYNPLISKIKHKISPPKSWIPYYWTPKSKRNTMCPKCEHKFSYEYKFNIFSFFCDILNILISPKKPYWLFVLLEKS